MKLNSDICRLTFDMSGRRQTAKPAVDCPLDGRVRRLAHDSTRKPLAQCTVFQSSSGFEDMYFASHSDATDHAQ